MKLLDDGQLCDVLGYFAVMCELMVTAADVKAAEDYLLLMEKFL